MERKGLLDQLFFKLSEAVIFTIHNEANIQQLDSGKRRRETAEIVVGEEVQVDQWHVQF